MYDVSTMRPYSLDLRDRIVLCLQNGSTQSQVAEQFSVSLASVQRFARQARVQGHLNPKPITGRKPIIGLQQQALLEELLSQQIDPKLAGVAHEWQARTGKVIGISTLHYTLQRLGYSCKKDTLCSGALRKKA